MPYETEDYIHLPNPDHPESDFRLNNKGNINIVGTTNFGNGIQARLGLLKGTGKSAVFVYLFSKPKWTMESAKEWLDKHREKVEKTMNLLNKDFEFTMPLVKEFTDDDGFYYIDLGLSTTIEDLQKDEMTDNALDEMVEELKRVKIAINDSHSHSLKDLIGPTVDAWRDDTNMMVRVRVRKKWENEIKDLIASGTPLGGSLEGRATKVIPEKGNKRVIDGVKLYGGALTDIPAAWNLRGSVKESKDCPGSLCTQIFKSLDGGEMMEIDLKKAVTAVHQAGYDNIMKLVKAGKVDREGSWSKPNAEDFKDVKAYSLMCLGKDPEGDPDLAGTYGYPCGTEGMVSRAAVITAKQAASGSRGAPNRPEIAAAADRILAEIDKTKEKEEEKSMSKEEDIMEKDEKTTLKKVLSVLKDVKEMLTKTVTSESIEKDDEVEKTVDSNVDYEDILKRLDALEQKEYKQEKVIKSLKEENEALKKQRAKERTDKLIKKAFENYQKLNPDKKDATEKTMMDEIAKEFTTEELEKDFDNCIRTVIKSQELAMKRIPVGDLPNTVDSTLSKMKSEDAKIADKLEKQLREQGKITFENKE